MQEVPLSPEIQGGKCSLRALGARATLLLLGCPIQVFWDDINLHPGAAYCTDKSGLFPGQESSTGAETSLATILARFLSLFSSSFQTRLVSPWLSRERW